MVRQILVVHDSEEAISAIQRAINANIVDNGVSVLSAQTIDQAVETVKVFNIHLTLYSPSVSEMSPVDIYHKIQPMADVQTVPMVLLTDQPSDQYQDALNGGVSSCLEFPGDLASLAKKVEQICFPQLQRSAARYSIPRTEVTLKQANCQLTGRVFNVSEGGLFCQLTDPKGFDWALPSRLTLTFNIDDEQTLITNIEAVPVNLNVGRLNPDFSPAEIRIAFRFVEVPKDSMHHLVEIFSNYNMLQRITSEIE